MKHGRRVHPAAIVIGAYMVTIVAILSVVTYLLMTTDPK